MNVQQRVENGIQLLNEKLGPNWHEKIDVDVLDISSIYRCIIGQLFGGWEPQVLGLPTGPGAAPVQVNHGFEVPAAHERQVSYNTEESALEEEWVRRILELRGETA